MPSAVKHLTKLLRNFFKSQRPISKSFLLRLRGYLCIWLLDSRYNATALENHFKNIFKLIRRLIDLIASAYLGIKVAIIAANILDAAPFLFSNYNPSTEKTSGLSNNNASKVNNITKASSRL